MRERQSRTRTRHRRVRTPSSPSPNLIWGSARPSRPAADAEPKTWMPGTRPGMTEWRDQAKRYTADTLLVIAGLGPAIHVLGRRSGKGVDARLKAGHDEEGDECES